MVIRMFAFRGGRAYFVLGDVELAGSWVVTSGVISPLIWVISTVTLLITPLITTHEPPSRLSLGSKVWVRGSSYKAPGSKIYSTAYARASTIDPKPDPGVPYRASRIEWGLMGFGGILFCHCRT